MNVIIKKKGVKAEPTEYWTGKSWTRRRELAPQFSVDHAEWVIRIRFWRFGDRIEMINPRKQNRKDTKYERHYQENRYGI